MDHGVTALLARSLRTDARALLNHLTRLGLMAAIYIALCCALAVAMRYGAPGMRFFKASVYLNAIFLTLLGIGFFSSTITEEKEEDTLGLMLMAGISPLGLLMGKLGGRLVQSLLLILVQYPFTLLAITMGGVSPSQVQAVYVGLIGYMLMMAGIGLLCSTLAPNSRRAGTMLVIVLLVYTVVPFVWLSLMWKLGWMRIGSAPSLPINTLMLIPKMSVFVQIETMMATGFGESPWSFQAISNAVLGVIGFFLSWCFFGLATRSPGTEAATRGGLSRSQKGVARGFSPGRVWENPLVWKDFHFVAGGLSMLLLRILFYTALFFVSLGLSSLWRLGGWGNGFTRMIGVYQFFLCCALSIETALLVSRCIHDEIRGQTLASLMMLPKSPVEIFYSKLFGSLLAAYPGFVVFVVACIFGIENTLEFLDPTDPGPFFLANFLLVPHLAAVYALWVRWGAVPLAIGTMIGFFALCIAIMEVMLRSGEEALVMVAFFILLGCAACHWIVVSRLRVVAERG